MRNPVDEVVRKRRAVAEALERHKLFISQRSYRDGTMVARVYVGPTAYDVRERELRALMAGKTPADLELEPLADPEAELR